MAKVIPFSKNREAIYDLLSRAKRYHCTSTSTCEIDVTQLMAALERERAAGRKVSFLACIVRATSLLLEKHPRLNHHLFHGITRKYEVDFEEISCNLIMIRSQEDGERILLPVILERSNEMSLEEIQETIRYHQRTPLDELPQIQAIQKLKKMPRIAMRGFSYLCRSNHKFYRKFFGTYGLSPLFYEDHRGVHEGKLGMVSHSISNTCTAFFPCGVSDQPCVVDGEVTSRKMMSMMMAIDHYLVDGHNGLLAMRDFGRLMASPSELGLGEGK